MVTAIRQMQSNRRPLETDLQRTREAAAADWSEALKAREDYARRVTEAARPQARRHFEQQRDWFDAKVQDAASRLSRLDAQLAGLRLV